ncbi:MAG TPA: ubiquinol oxidase subunit II [Spirochaetia bacterium]|nr:ubiquinol oxidase subunit II [Spirochaetia bacterium]
MKKLKLSAIVKFMPFSLLVFLSGCSTMPILDPKGQVGTDEKNLIIIAAVLMLIVIIPVVVMTFVFARKFRASNTKAVYKPEWAHSRGIETIVWGVPILIVAALSVLSWVTTHSLDPFKPLAIKGKPVTIEVVSMDWKWLFIYPEEGIATVNQIAIPTNTPINFKLTSATVMNSFFIPRLGSQIYTMAGMQTQLHLVANHAGTYDGLSSSFSGRGFSGMTFKTIATSKAEFDDWVKKVKASSKTLDDASYKELAKPSEDNPVEYYSTVSPNLFDTILHQYMATMKAGASS